MCPAHEGGDKVEVVADTWESWKSQLASAVKLGESMNMSQEQLAERAAQVGDFLAKRIDVKNPEQKVLKELWEAADEKEQEVIAGVIVKLVSGKQVH